MRFRLSFAGLLVLVVLLVPAAANAAQLVGGREQTAIAKAFFARRSHKGRAIVSTRVSTVAHAWAVVKSVRPQAPGRRSASGLRPRLRSTYYHLTKGREKLGTPPPAVRTDLARDFRVTVLYTGSGSEAIVYHQGYRSVCPGSGGFTDEEAATIKPMSWSVRYVVDLDALQSAVRASAGTILVPTVFFDSSRSKVSAHEVRTRTAIDTGCNGQPTTFECDTTYAPGVAGDGLLSFPPTGGLEVGVPVTANPSGDCDPSDFTLGPSLWDAGATTAVTPVLGLVGARLPAQPYAPVPVSWPGTSLSLVSGFPVSPCQGDGAACRDTFRWTGHVALQAAS